MRNWLVLIALACSAAGAVPVWRWVDETGVVHYSDRPVEGAEQIELIGAQTFPAAEERPVARPSRSDAPSQAPKAYVHLEIVSPRAQETLWNIGGTLEVQIELEPPLQQGHRFDVILDGELQNLTATASPLIVAEVWRGAHTVQAVVRDTDGTQLARSAQVPFTVQQTSIQNPNNPIAPRRRRN